MFPAPRQLPLGVTEFINREEQLAELDAFLPLDTLDGQRATRFGNVPVVISAIAGTPGIGKTALAVHWAHRVRHHYEDGDLYINMRGYGSGPAVSVEHVLDSFLRALNVTPDRIPSDLEERSAIYRSMLNGKRVLVIIDNASSVNQVRPLLPGSSSCMTIVTSRNTLPGLVAREGAVRMVIGVLSMTESLELLRRIVGAERVDMESAAAEQLVKQCAYLPLALRIIAERITSHPYTDLADFAEELADERACLDALEIEDDELSDVRAVFSSSYRALNPNAARMFRLLGLHPGPEFSAPAAAALAGLDPKATRRLLDILTGSHLVQLVAPERYLLHDLLRVYAVECAEVGETALERAASTRRVLLWYLVSVYNGHKVILPRFHSVPIDIDEMPITPLSFDDVDRAMQWFESEKNNLLDALRVAMKAEQFDIAWKLPAVMYGFFELRSYWSDWREIHVIGVRAAELSGDRYGEACNYLGLGDANWLLRRLDEALVCYQTSTAAGREVGDGWIEGFSLRQTGVLLLEAGQFEQAIAVIGKSIDVFRAVGERRGEGMALVSLGNCYRSRGLYGEAIDHAHKALRIFAEIEDGWSVAWGRCALGAVLNASGGYEESLGNYRLALETFVKFEDRLNESRALIGVAEAHVGMNNRSEAQIYVRRATTILENLEDAEVADLWERIGPLDDANS
ncbi:tetratricopeptide repeat protein [Streptosporangium sp. NPDC006007]|uniref:ATP-binding protein n=1 Tax=Streptosporangium sp. NPDC006007 TaxID=3154575 RepID=UPI0033ACE751